MTDNATAVNFTVSAPRAGTSYGDFESRYDGNASTVGSIKTYVLILPTVDALPSYLDSKSP